MSYILRFPFEIITDKYEIIELERVFEFNGLNLSVEKHGKHYTFVVSSFETQEEAEDRELRKKLWVTLSWIMLQKGIPLRASIDKYKVVQTKVLTPPKITPNGITITPEPAVVYIDASIGRAFISAPLDTLDESLKQGIFAKNSMAVFEGEGKDKRKKLKIALDLYALHFINVSDETRFITLITVLEALKEPQNEIDDIRSVIEEWIQLINKRIKELSDSNSSEFKAYKSLQGSLGHLKKISIKRQILKLVESALGTDPNIDIEERLKRTGQLYDIRSRLLHSGTLEKPDNFKNDLKDAEEITKKVLIAELRKTAGISLENNMGD